MNLDKVIKTNSLPEITSPVYFDKQYQPASNGIFSYELFGVINSSKRRYQFGYIALGRKFLHPLVYRTLQRLYTKLPGLIAGTEWAKLTPKGVLVPAGEDEEGAGTGLSFLYNSWKAIIINRTNSSQRDKRIEMLELLDRDEAFIDKWLIIPPAYRDVDITSGRMSVEVLSPLYSKVLSLSSVLKEESTSSITLLGRQAEAKLQLALNELYDELIAKESKKSGLIRHYLLGKTLITQ